jgi:cytochrome c oxidase subunit 2
MIKIAAVVTAVVIALIVIVTAIVAKSAAEKKDGVQASIYKLRSFYFYFLIVVIAGLLFVTLKSGDVPYPETKTGAPDLVVDVTGRTWSWELSTDKIPSGKIIEFAVSTEDVNHGFGIYSPEGKILGQVQVMPGYTNKLRYRFEKEGEYKILCMEYCGAVHHNMISGFTVVSAEAMTSGDNK